MEKNERDPLQEKTRINNNPYFGVINQMKHDIQCYMHHAVSCEERNMAKGIPTTPERAAYLKALKFALEVINLAIMKHETNCVDGF